MVHIREIIPRTYEAFLGQFPTIKPAQEISIPIIMEDKNLLLISPTGSGKTEAVVAPICEKALDQTENTYCLYICPTKALVNDIERRIESSCYKVDISVAVRHGDRKTLRGKKVPNILITTPESLDVMLGSKNQSDKTRLQSVHAVIIDEVHQFYQTPRGFQLTILLERLKRKTKSPLQRILLSATIANPEKVARWFRGSDEPIEIVPIPGGRSIGLELEYASADTGDKYRGGEFLFPLIEPVLEKHKKVLLFANSRNECDWLYWRLQDHFIKDNISTELFLHYSTLPKDFRELVEANFNKSSKALCIATSTLELGIDIGDIDAVIMYGAPATISSFTQRIGRGNRRSSHCTAYGICRDYHINGIELGAENDLIQFFSLIASISKSELEELPETKYYSVLVQQIFSLTNQYENIIKDVLIRLIEKIPDTSENMGTEIDLIFNHLLDSGFYSYVKPEYYPTQKWDKVKENLEIWANIPRTFYEKVIDHESSVEISQVPLKSSKTGVVFLYAGKTRMVTEVKGNIVKTIDIFTHDPKFIMYDSVPASTPIEVAYRARDILSVQTFPDLPITIEKSGKLDDLMKANRKKFRDFPFEYFIPFEIIDGRYYYYTFAGTWVNEFLSIVLRKRGFVAEIDSLRVITNKEIDDFSQIPNKISDFELIIKENFKYFLYRQKPSGHFMKLPKNLQVKELVSIINLPRISEEISKIITRNPKRIN